MSNIQTWLDNFKKEVDEYEKLVGDFRDATSGEAQLDATANLKMSTDCEAKASRIRVVKKSFSNELSQVKDRMQRAEFDSKAKALDESVMKLSNEVRALKLKANKAELMKGVPIGKAAFSIEGKGNDELLAAAMNIQDKSFESLGRTRNMIEASKQVGADTIEELRRQRDQIKDIEKEVDNIDSNLRRAEKLVFEFSRRLATDKIIQGFAALNIVVMLGLILYVAISGKSLTATAQDSYNNVVGGSPSPPPTIMPTAAPSL